MEREVRYCTTEDGVRVAYCVEGEGPAVLFLPAFVASFQLVGDSDFGRELYRIRGEGRMVVRYDMRGTGLSQRSATDFSLTALLTRDRHPRGRRS